MSGIGQLPLRIRYDCPASRSKIASPNAGYVAANSPAASVTVVMSSESGHSHSGALPPPKGIDRCACSGSQGGSANHLRSATPHTDTPCINCRMKLDSLRYLSVGAGPRLLVLRCGKTTSSNCASLNLVGFLCRACFSPCPATKHIGLHLYYGNRTAQPKRVRAFLDLAFARLHDCNDYVLTDKEVARFKSRPKSSGRPR
ncbi:hypothetical protein B0G69_4525 [Paraburkholderia sp. RAU2J]|nr:hypothetical protein B0G69_4525 [Paraburkholderia sp. RAU2J]